MPEPIEPQSIFLRYAEREQLTEATVQSWLRGGVKVQIAMDYFPAQLPVCLSWESRCFLMHCFAYVAPAIEPLNATSAVHPKADRTVILLDPTISILPESIKKGLSVAGLLGPKDSVCHLSESKIPPPVYKAARLVLVCSDPITILRWKAFSQQHAICFEVSSPEPVSPWMTDGSVSWFSEKSLIPVRDVLARLRQLLQEKKPSLILKTETSIGISAAAYRGALKAGGRGFWGRLYETERLKPDANQNHLRLYAQAEDALRWMCAVHSGNCSAWVQAYVQMLSLVPVNPYWRVHLAWLIQEMPNAYAAIQEVIEHSKVSHTFDWNLETALVIWFYVLLSDLDVKERTSWIDHASTHFARSRALFPNQPATVLLESIFNQKVKLISHALPSISDSVCHQVADLIFAENHFFEAAELYRQIADRIKPSDSSYPNLLICYGVRNWLDEGLQLIEQKEGCSPVMSPFLHHLLAGPFRALWIWDSDACKANEALLERHVALLEGAIHLRACEEWHFHLLYDYQRVLGRVDQAADTWTRYLSDSQLNHKPSVYWIFHHWWDGHPEQIEGMLSAIDPQTFSHLDQLSAYILCAVTVEHEAHIRKGLHLLHERFPMALTHENPYSYLLHEVCWSAIARRLGSPEQMAHFSRVQKTNLFYWPELLRRLEREHAGASVRSQRLFTDGLIG
jgi:hypothetical protein